MGCAKIRATTSSGPPAGKGTTMVTVRAGQSWALRGLKRRQHDDSERGGDEPCQHCLTLRFECILRFLRFQRSFAVGSR